MLKRNDEGLNRPFFLGLFIQHIKEIFYRHTTKNSPITIRLKTIL